MISRNSARIDKDLARNPSDQQFHLPLLRRQSLNGDQSPVGSFGYSYKVGQASLPVTVSLPNGAYITNAYDTSARLLSTILKNNSHTLLNDHEYAYDAANRRTSQVRIPGSATNSMAYTYDAIGQLKTAKGTG